MGEWLLTVHQSLKTISIETDCCCSCSCGLVVVAVIWEGGGGGGTQILADTERIVTVILDEHLNH